MQQYCQSEDECIGNRNVFHIISIIHDVRITVVRDNICIIENYDILDEALEIRTKFPACSTLSIHIG